MAIHITCAPCYANGAGELNPLVVGYESATESPYHKGAYLCDAHIKTAVQPILFSSLI